MFVIKIEQKNEREFVIEFESDELVGSIHTSSPQKAILQLLSDEGIKGKRGPVKGTRRVSKAVDDGAAELENFSPATAVA